MSTSVNGTVIAGGMLIAAVMCAALLSGQKREAKEAVVAPAEMTREYEFVCYTDDKLSERHVGVVSAIYIRSGDTKIRYKEGGSAVYRQVPGEACALEKVNP